MIHRVSVFKYCLVIAVLVIVFSQPVLHARSWIDQVSLTLEEEVGYMNYRAIIEDQSVAELTLTEKERVEKIFRRLVQGTIRRHEIEYRLTVLEDRNVNAFALPGGYVFLNFGLLKFVKNDGELAGVLSHELAHVECRHGMEAVTRAVGLALIISLFLNEHSELVSRLASMALNLAQLGYSRAAEFEADKVGYGLMRKADYSKADLLRFWRRLQKAEEGKDFSFPGMRFFSTHPPVKERIQRIEVLP